MFRSNRYIFAQLIDDEKGHTILGISEKEIDKNPPAMYQSGTWPAGGGNKTDRARKLGILLAKKGLSKKIKAVVFDRGGFKYHVRIKALAEGAREGGLKF